MNATIPALMLGVLLSATGCQTQTFEVDLSKLDGFTWTGKLRVTEIEQYSIGPFLTFEKRWEVDRVSLPSGDGRAVTVRPGRGSQASAEIGAAGLTPLPITGGTTWQGGGLILVPAPESPQPHGGAKNRPQLHVPYEKRPYRVHAAELTFGEWWAIALNDASRVSMQFPIESEGLEIRVSGDPRSYGPDLLEVITADGKVIFRSERQPIQATPLPPADSAATP